MAPTIEKISAITFRVSNMKAAVQLYRNVLGMELLYGGEQASFSSLRANDSDSAILNLEQGDTVSRWGRLIFHVTDVDPFWTHLKQQGFHPESRGTRPGVNSISTCSIRMATNCPLLGRCNELPTRRNVSSRPLVPEWQFWTALKLIFKWQPGRGGCRLSQLLSGFGRRAWREQS
jgi:catechol 2,3-dioxygenase-like lactoylglutathione lyase family enzyme